jgi:transketolase
MRNQQKEISPKEARKMIIELSRRANIGHIGSALSVVDIITAIYSNAFNFNRVNPNERDRFILSNGHTSLALYVVLNLAGILPDSELQTFCEDGSFLGVHPDVKITGVDFTSGSLGQGLSFGAGSALAAKLQNSDRRIFVVMSDAECNEGGVWEAVMFAAHRQLSNLIVIIDMNGQQAMGYTKDVLNLQPMSEKWRAFQWDTHTVNGNSTSELTKTLNSLNSSNGQPHVVIANTTFGKGVSFMENKIKWHYLPVSPEEYDQALKEIENQ